MNTAEAEPIRVPIERDGDVVNARQTGRALAVDIGFRGTDLTLIATAITMRKWTR